jgi:hypothetical protein
VLQIVAAAFASPALRSSKKNLSSTRKVQYQIFFRNSTG